MANLKISELPSDSSGGGYDLIPVVDSVTGHTSKMLIQTLSDFIAANHTHLISQVVGLETALSNKASITHTHPLSALTASGATTGQYAKWDGSAWVPSDVAVGGSDTMISGGKSFALLNFPNIGYFSDDGNVWCGVSTTTITVIDFEKKKTATRNITSDYTGANAINGIAFLGDYLYVLANHATTGLKMYRYARANISAGGTLMTASFLGNNTATRMACDGTKLFFSQRGGKTTQAFGDATSRFTISEPVSGTWRYTWNGTGTNPNFVSNGLTVGKTLVIAGATNTQNNGSFVVTAVSASYIEISNETIVLLEDNFSSNPLLNGWGTDQPSACVYDATNTQIDINGSNVDFRRPSNDILMTPQNYKFYATISNYVSGTGYFWVNTNDYAGVPYAFTISGNGNFSGVLNLPEINPIFTRYAGVGVNGGSFNFSINDIKIEKAGGTAETNSACTFTLTFLDCEILPTTISGTNLTAETSISCGSTAGFFDSFAVNSTHIFSEDSDSPYLWRKFDKTTGALVDTSALGFLGGGLISTNAGIFSNGAGYSNVFFPIPL